MLVFTHCELSDEALVRQLSAPLLLQVAFRQPARPVSRVPKHSLS